jgi:hypothetical protein
MQISFEQIKKILARTQANRGGPMKTELLRSLRDWILIFSIQIFLLVCILAFCFFTLWQSNKLIGTEIPVESDTEMVDRDALDEALSHFQASKEAYEKTPTLPTSLVDPAR